MTEQERLRRIREIAREAGEVLEESRLELERVLALLERAQRRLRTSR